MIANYKTHFFTAPLMALFFLLSSSVCADKHAEADVSISAWLQASPVPDRIVAGYLNSFSDRETSNAWVEKKDDVLYVIFSNALPLASSSQLYPTYMSNAIMRARHLMSLYAVSAQYDDYGFQHKASLLDALQSVHTGLSTFLKDPEHKAAFLNDSVVVTSWIGVSDITLMSTPRLAYEDILSPYCDAAYAASQRYFSRDFYALASPIYHELIHLSCSVPPSFFIEASVAFLDEGDTQKARQLAIHAFHHLLEADHYSSQYAEMLGDVLWAVSEEEKAEAAYWSAIKKM